MIQTINLTPGVVLRHYPDHRFKTAILSVQLLRPMCREEAALNALLSSVLLRGCKNYPDMRAITARQDELYGAGLPPLLRRVGNIQTVGLFCSFLEDRFALPGEQVMAPAFELLRQLLLEPKTVEGCFDPEFVESEKRNLIADIESELNDKRSYAATQMLRHLCDGDSFAVPIRGTVEDVRAITPRSLYEHYQKILRTSPAEIFYVGSASAEETARCLMPLASALAAEPMELPEQTTGPIQGIALAGPYGDPLTANLLNRAQFGSAEEAISAVKADPLFAEEVRMDYDAEGLGIAVQLLGGYSEAKTTANTVWYLVYEDGTLARLPWPANTVELAEEAPSKEGYCLTYEAVTEDGKTYTYFINPLYRTYSVKELKSTRSEVPLTVPSPPSTAEAALEELQKHSTILNRWDGPVFSLLEASEKGTPHPSNNYYCLLVDGSGVIHLPSMPRVSAFGEASPDKVGFSEDGAVLTYSCYFAEREGTELGSPSENVYHEVGTYTYRVEIMNRRVILTYDPDAR